MINRRKLFGMLAGVLFLSAVPVLAKNVPIFTDEDIVNIANIIGKEVVWDINCPMLREHVSTVVYDYVYKFLDGPAMKIKVVCDETNNPPELVSNGYFNLYLTVNNRRIVYTWSRHGMNYVVENIEASNNDGILYTDSGNFSGNSEFTFNG